MIFFTFAFLFENTNLFLLNNSFTNNKEENHG